MEFQPDTLQVVVSFLCPACHEGVVVGQTDEYIHCRHCGACFYIGEFQGEVIRYAKGDKDEQ